ncbi:MAG: carboxypeptidase-like regulatory domain-containing protein, partial [Steroidobacteraceae bacterium]
IFGLVLLLVGGGVLLLFGRQWTSTTTASTPVSEKPATPQLVAPPAARIEPPPVEATTPTTTATTVSAQTGTFRGRVIDATTRQPVPEFEVQLIGVPRGHIIGNEPQVTQSFQSTDGRFAWQQAPAGHWNVRVAAQRYQHFLIDGISIAAGKATREVVMPLRLGHTLKGRVFDQSSGAGIGEARIGVRDASVPGPDPLRSRYETSKTKADGSFVLDGVPGGDVIVTANAKDHAWGELTVTVNENTPPVQIGLATGGRIAGMVVAPDGTPAKGRLMLAGPGIPWSSATDETGSFAFAHRPPGHYQLTANTSAGNAKLEFELGENEIKEGIVLQVGAG